MVVKTPMECQYGVLMEERKTHKRVGMTLDSLEKQRQ